jgi:hypothetical protein
MSRLIPALSAAVAVAGSLLAQNVTEPAIFASAEGGTTGNVWRAGINRVQCFYDTSNFVGQNAGHPITITNLDFRLGGGLATAITTYPSVNIYLQNAATDYLAPSTTFATNRTVAFPTTPNYSGPITTVAVPGTTPNGFFISVALSTPFTYIADNGADLLMEIEILSAPAPVVGNTISAGFVAATHACNSIRSVGSTAALTGSASPFAPVVRFTYTESPTSARKQLYGSGCGSAGQSFYEQFPGSTNDLGGKTVTMTQNVNNGYDVATTVGATVVPPVSVALVLGDDVVSASAINLPFTFNYPGGGATTQIRVDSNGSVLLNGTTTSNIGGSAAALLTSVVHRLCPSMQDLDPSSGGGVFAEADPSNPTTVYLITWQGVPCFNTPVTGLTSTFQVALIDNGTNDSVEFRYSSLTNDSSSNTGIAITGFSRGGTAVDPGNRDLTAGSFSTSADRPALALNSTRSVINSTVNITTSNIPPTGVSLLFISTGQLNPGVDLGFLGLTGGCNAYVVLPEFLSFLNIGTPTAVSSVPLANDPTLVGIQAFCQSAALDPSYNSFGAVVSNGLKLVVGDS